MPCSYSASYPYMHGTSPREKTWRHTNPEAWALDPDLVLERIEEGDRATAAGVPGGALPSRTGWYGLEEREKLSTVWAQLSTWRVQDGQFPELGVGDIWKTRFEVILDDAEEVLSATPVGIRMIGDPLTPIGPRYEIVGRVHRDEVVGTSLDAREIVVAPTAYSTWPEGTVLRTRSEFYGSEALDNEPPDPLIRSWRVRELFIRYARAVPDRDPNSWRRDLTDVRFLAVERMRMWDDDDHTGKNPFNDGARLPDYLLEIDSIA